MGDLGIVRQTKAPGTREGQEFREAHVSGSGIERAWSSLTHARDVRAPRDVRGAVGRCRRRASARVRMPHAFPQKPSLTSQLGRGTRCLLMFSRSARHGPARPESETPSLRPVRLAAQDTALSRRRHGFKSRTGYHERRPPPPGGGLLFHWPSGCRRTAADGVWCAAVDTLGAGRRHADDISMPARHR